MTLLMHQQPELPLGITSRERPPARRPPGGASLDERFDAFHSAHPWVYEALEELMVEWVKSGGGPIGIKALFEQLRWSSRQVDGGEPFRLNNNFTSRYARLLCARHPEWAGVFQLRHLRTRGRRELELDAGDHVK
ncbi:hypothetical protein ACH4ZX_12400 [Streptomyces sp. NPDC020490]|uniref:hypothetical protein n=1 Tax=Streptomyces sp. NPDC020490 TaxID=3365078 RepID=UPI0037B65D32